MFIPLLHPWVYLIRIVNNCSLESSWLGKTANNSTPPTCPSSLCSSSGRMKACQQRKSFLVSTNFISSCLVIKACGVIINRVLPSSSYGQPRAMVIPVFFFWGGECISKTCLTNNSYLVLGVLFTNPCLLGWALSIHRGNLCSKSSRLCFQISLSYSSLPYSFFSYILSLAYPSVFLSPFPYLFTPYLFKSSHPHSPFPLSCLM